MPSHSHSKSASHHHAHNHPQRHPLALTITAEGGAGGGSNNNNSIERIEWSRSTILGFIEDYRRQRVLWDPNTKGYHIKQIKYEALKQLGLKYGTEIRSIRSKIKSLRSSFHREHGKVINGQRRGIHYQPMWFAYEAIRFILDGEQLPPQQTQQLQQQQQQQQHNHQRSLLHDVGESNAAKRAANAVDGADGVVAGDDDDDEDDDDDDDGDEGDETVAGVAGDGVGERVVVTAQLAQEDDDDKTQVGRQQQQQQQAAKQRHSASGNNNNNTAAGAAAASASSDDDEHGVKHAADSDAEMQHFGNIISAEDVKTELIESDHMPDMQKSPLAYLALTPTVSTSCAKKRKRTPQPDDLSSAAASHQLHKHDSPTSSKFAHNSASRAQEPCSSTTTTTATTTSHNYNHHNSNGNNNNNSNNNSSSSNNTSFSSAGQTDEYGVFGEYVAITIRKLKTSKAKIVVKHLINNLLYEAELGKYDYGIPASKEPPQLYKT